MCLIAGAYHAIVYDAVHRYPFAMPPCYPGLHCTLSRDTITPKSATDRATRGVRVHGDSAWGRPLVDVA